jgi:hypothetical protein
MPRDVARLHRALDRLTPALRRDIERAFARLRRKLGEDRLLSLLERNDEFALRAALSNFSTELAATEPTITAAFRVGTAAAVRELPTLTARMAFNVTNPEATKAAERSAAQLVTQVTDETRQAIRSVVQKAFSEQLTPRDTAKLIRPLIGLTERQALAVINLRYDLIKQGVPGERIYAAVEKYAAKLLKQRAELIARTEIIRASTEGQRELWRQAKAQGLISREMQIVWITTPDDRLCPTCAAMDGQTVGIESGSFAVETRTSRRSRRYAVSGPPAHPRCRCTVGLKRKPATGRIAA